ncbi:D-alanyl-D-alanine carboxypeptidase/D-alanyl-D-alanine endopeptidase [Mangrovibacterium lignilyticum]|uniref:D-alanyl-D-alanine carboxypeptidase/D-alanyl-D-alanine endopeptidase n=1 Tax=Mangrovibacterium lignilyticum TaxID=2668052 RepID=UPI0013D2EEE0|nr:D-alanyl-D-alanine carboxypeptidase/D-alanyl-D-alanine-endopeptidase [Mangrovibacterium lignilyticum]
MKHYLRITLLFVLFCLTLTVVEAQEKEGIQHIYNDWSRQEILENASVGFYAVDAKTGELLAASTPQQSLVPASILKLLTTSTGLELLGTDYRFETKLAYNGVLKNDTLFGDIILIAGGDPALGSKYFKDYQPYQNFVGKWAEAIKKQHIKHITGNLIIDTSVYDDQSIPATWIWEDMGNYYGAGVFALSAYDNLYELHLSSPTAPEKPTQLLYTLPVLPDVEFDNRVLSSSENSDKAFVFGSPLDHKRIIRGTIPKDRTDFVVKASIPNPPYLVGTQLEQELGLLNIELSGTIQCGGGDKTEDMTTISVIKSPTLAEIISVTNHESVNLFAEHILKQIAYETTGLGTTEAGIELVLEFWEQQGMDIKPLFMEDGSGLSRFNAITPKQMVFVLNYMKNKSSNSDAFFDSLPVVPNGTLWYFNHSYFPKKALRAKSGSMTRVRSFAGELKTQSKRDVLFAILLNNFSCSQSQAIKTIEKLLVKIENQ